MGLFRVWLHSIRSVRLDVAGLGAGLSLSQGL